MIPLRASISFDPIATGVISELQEIHGNQFVLSKFVSEAVRMYYGDSAKAKRIKFYELIKEARGLGKLIDLDVVIEALSPENKKLRAEK